MGHFRCESPQVLSILLIDYTNYANGNIVTHYVVQQFIFLPAYVYIFQQLVYG